MFDPKAGKDLSLGKTTKGKKKANKGTESVLGPFHLSTDTHI